MPNIYNLKLSLRHPFLLHKITFGCWNEFCCLYISLVCIVLVKSGHHSCIIVGTRHLVALHHAALKNHLEIAKSLIRANAKLDPIGYKDFNDYQEPFTPLRMAAHEGHFDIVRLLVDSGYDLHQESYLWEELDLPRKLKNNAPLMSFMHFHLHMPPSLARRCIQTIRRVCSEDIFSKVMSMEYPSSLKNSILLTDVLNDC